MTDGLNGCNKYSFGEFAYDRADNTLRRNGEVLAMTPRALDLLRVFIASPGKLLTKDELMSTVWPDTFVEESNLAVTIRRLRKALGDDAHKPVYIETVARQGYRFVAEIRQSHVPDAKASPTTARSFRYIIPLAFTAGLLIASISLGSLYLRGGRFSAAAPILSTPFAAEKLSTTGKVSSAIVSPDGNKVVYSLQSGAGEGVWLREIPTENNVEIIPASDQDYYSFVMSPDGATLYFTRGPRTSDDSADLFSVSIFGGVPKKLVSNTRGWISISPDGDTISFIRCGESEEMNCALLTANSSDGGDERIIASRAHPYRIAAHEITPDGKSIIFAAGQSQNAGNDFELVSVDLQSGAERRLTNERFFTINSIEILPDNSGMLFTAIRSGARYQSKIWRLNYSEGSVESLNRDANSYSSISLDDSGSRLVATQVTNDSRLFRRSFSDQEQDGTIADQVWLFAFDPEGEVLYQSDSTGDIEIWRMKADGSNQRLLTNSPGNDIAPIASRDASEVYFCSNRSGQMEVWRMNADGSDQRVLTRENGGIPVFAADDWIYYQHGIDRTLWRVSRAGDRQEQVLTITPHSGPFVFSPTGTRMAFVDLHAGQRTIRIVSVPDGREQASLGPIDGKGRLELAWLPDESSIAYSASALEGETNTLWLQSVAGGSPRVAATLGDEEIRVLAFAPGSDFIAFVQGGWKHDAVLLSGLQ